MKSRDKKARPSIGINLSCDFSPALPLCEKVSKRISVELSWLKVTRKIP